MGDNQSFSPLPEEFQSILDYLNSQNDWVEEVLVAAELNLSLPVLRQRLNQLLEKELIESDGDGQWRTLPESNNCQIDKREIIIDRSLQSLIPALQKSEYFQLETNILQYGICEPIVVWAGRNILLDGHNRYEIAQKHSLPFKVVEIELPDKEAAQAWLIDNQLGRRNLNPTSLSYLRGKRYHLLKAKVTNPSGKNQYQNSTSPSRQLKSETEEEVGGQNDHQAKTEERLSRKYKVGTRTIRRDGEFASAIDIIASVTGDESRSKLLNKEISLTKQATQDLAEIALSHPEVVKAAFETGTTGKEIIEQVEKKLAPTESESNAFSVGDVCWLLAVKEPELLAHSGFWGVIEKVHTGARYYDVVIYKGVVVRVPGNNLKLCDYSESERAKALALVERLNRIMEREPSSSVVAVIQDISRRNVTTLEDMEEQILSIAEEKLGISPKKNSSPNNEFKPEKLSSKELISHVIGCFDYLTTLNLQSVAESLTHRRPECIEALTTTLANDPETAEVMIRALESKYPHLLQNLVEKT